MYKYALYRSYRTCGGVVNMFIIKAVFSTDCVCGMHTTFIEVVTQTVFVTVCLTLSDVTVLPDPCPLPDKLKKRSLNEREKLVFCCWWSRL